MAINDINFGQLYKEHILGANRWSKKPSDWDDRADSMTQTQGRADDPYVCAFIEKMQLDHTQTPMQTLLDIGCGPGTISLAVADQFNKVYGLDYSTGMLNAMREKAQKFGVTNFECIQKSWDDAHWDDVPVCDIVVASRALMVNDIEDAIDKLNSKAKKRIYTTLIVDNHFIAHDINKYIGRKSAGFPNYIYAVNVLNQLGYKPHVDYIDTSLGKKQPENFEQFVRSVVWSIGDVSPQEVEKLKVYYDERVAQSLPVNRTSRCWAFVWWDAKG